MEISMPGAEPLGLWIGRLSWGNWACTTFAGGISRLRFAEKGLDVGEGGVVLNELYAGHIG